MHENSNSNRDFDICIIGAGPAGSSVGIELLKLGFRVCIVEKSKFPRPHIGICFSQDIYTVADFLDLRAAIDKSVIWSRKTINLKWEKEAIKHVEQVGIHVERGILDEALLLKAKNLGAIVYQPISSLNLEEQEKHWAISFNNNNKNIALRALFIVDATGRGGSILKERRIKFQANLLAVHATWSLNAPPSCDGYMEAFCKGWSWGAYLGNNKLLVSIYTDANIIKGEKSSIENFYLNTVKALESIQKMDLKALVSNISTCDASSYCQSNLIGDNYIKVGDAAFTIDPLSSQGVFLALSSAFAISRVIRTILDTSKDSTLAQAFYKDFIRDRINIFKTKLALEYSRVSAYADEAFWKKRNKISIEQPKDKNTTTINYDNKQRYCLNAKASIIKTAILTDNFIEAALAIKMQGESRACAFINGINIVEFLNKYKVAHKNIYYFGMESNEMNLHIINFLYSNQYLEIAL